MWLIFYMANETEFGNCIENKRNCVGCKDNHWEFDIGILMLVNEKMKFGQWENEIGHLWSSEIVGSVVVGMVL